MQRFRLVLLVLAISSAAAWAVEPPRHGGGIVKAADSGADDRERGYSDGLNGKDARERDQDYRAGYSAGRARHQANEARRPDGREYARGYRDGFNRWRERIAVPSDNKTYAAGYRAGQADHRARFTAAPTTGGARADYQRGFDDAVHGRPLRDKNNNIPAYREGYSAGKGKGDPSWLDKGVPNPTDR